MRAWNRNQVYRRFLKRAIDVVVASGGLVVLAPLLAVVAVVVRVALGSPVLFKQCRPGRCEKPFVLLKFRTMKSGPDAIQFDSNRMTRVGSILRRWSLDELPALWNVVVGDMSLVGPRPLLMQYLPRYTQRQRQRHDVRPGITGLAQVSGRNCLDWDRRLDLDVLYVHSYSSVMDFRILCRTIQVIVSRVGISEEGHATKSEFIGSRQ
jgi:sugar transferase EpsL